MGFPEPVQQALRHLWERWGGKGMDAPRLGIRRVAGACTKSVSAPGIGRRA